jgi:isoquinoline 1-oxidoreductase beta subunit
VTADRAEIWGPIQAPDWVRGHLAGALGLPLERVTVHMTFLGGGFGRKAFTDWTHEAAMVSKAIGGPVQVVWTREDDLTQGPFRPGMVYRCRGAVANGRVHAFEATMAGQNMGTQEPGSDPRAFNRDIIEGIHEGWFDAIGHWRFGDAPLASPIPVMWWRSVYSSTNGFAYESFIDELAAKAGVDPFTFRRRHLRDARTTALLDRLAAVSGWDGRTKGQGYGMAHTFCFGSAAAHVVKVRRADRGVAIERIWSVIDCGLAVNPDGVTAQVEGSVVMALAAACTHEMTFAGGQATRRNFDAYRLPMLRDVPPIEVHVLDSDHPPGGAGEPGLPGVAPALCNAIADLTGTRIRRLPFSLAEV